MSRRKPIVDTPESDSDNGRASNEMHMESLVREQIPTKAAGFGLDVFLDSAFQEGSLPLTIPTPKR
jgi:hypothetical protein